MWRVRQREGQLPGVCRSSREHRGAASLRGRGGWGRCGGRESTLERWSGVHPVSRAGVLEGGWVHASGASGRLLAGHSTDGSLCVVPSILPLLSLHV